MNEKYLIVNHSDGTFRFCYDKEEAVKIAAGAIGFEGEEAIIYSVKRVGVAYIPDPQPIIEWEKD